MKQKPLSHGPLSVISEMETQMLQLSFTAILNSQEASRVKALLWSRDRNSASGVGNTEQHKPHLTRPQDVKSKWLERTILREVMMELKSQVKGKSALATLSASGSARPGSRVRHTVVTQRGCSPEQV